MEGANPPMRAAVASAALFVCVVMPVLLISQYRHLVRADTPYY
jgi:hypothetical protein